jgi:hypothetical protein
MDIEFNVEIVKKGKWFIARIHKEKPVFIGIERREMRI